MAPPFVKVVGGQKPASIWEAKWEAVAEKLEFDALANVRATATKWAATIGTLTGIFSIVTLVKGPEDISKVKGSFLSISAEAWIGIALGFAVFFAVVATLSAASAAQGGITSFRFVGAEVRRQQRRQAREAAVYLVGAEITAVVAVVFLAIGIGITWYATPSEPAPASKVLIIDKTGRSVCGQLQKGAKGTLVVSQKGIEQPAVVMTNDVADVATIAECPASGG